MNQNNRNVFISLAVALAFVLLAVFMFSREEDGAEELTSFATPSETMQQLSATPSPMLKPSPTPPANAWLFDPTAMKSAISTSPTMAFTWLQPARIVL